MNKIKQIVIKVKLLIQIYFYVGITRIGKVFKENIIFINMKFYAGNKLKRKAETKLKVVCVDSNANAVT